MTPKSKAAATSNRVAAGAGRRVNLPLPIYRSFTLFNDINNVSANVWQIVPLFKGPANMAIARFDTAQTAQRPVSDALAAAAGATALRGARISLINTLDGLAGLESGWRKLEAANAGSHAVFQTFDWIRSWATAYATPGGNTELSIVIGYRGDELLFVWPLMKVSYGPVKILRWASEPLSQYGDVLLAKGEHAKSWLEAALKFIRCLRNIDAIRLRHVRADAVVAPFLGETFRDARARRTGALARSFRLLPMTPPMTPATTPISASAARKSARAWKTALAQIRFETARSRQRQRRRHARCHRREMQVDR